MTTIKDVAALAGVSPASVTRVLRDYPYVSQELRERVLEAVDACNYRPDLLATSLRIGQTQVVGLVLSTITNVTLASIVDALERELAANDFGVIVSSSHADPLADARGVERLSQRRVDALILVPQDETQNAMLATLRQLTIPIVSLDRQLDVPGLSTVVSDHFSGMQQLLEHLLAQGHRRIGLITPTARSFPSRERIRAYRQVVGGAATSGDGDLVSEVPLTEGAASEALARLVGRPEPPTAIVCAGGVLLLGALKEARCRGLRIGRDLALAAVDDWPFTDLLEPGITVLSRDLQELGRRTAALTLDLLRDRTPRVNHIVLPMRLVVRSSTLHATW